MVLLQCTVADKPNEIHAHFGHPWSSGAARRAAPAAGHVLDRGRDDQLAPRRVAQRIHAGLKLDQARNSQTS